VERAGTLLRSLAWLKRMNARGYDVTVRPAGPHGLLLLDGLQEADLQRLDARGWQAPPWSKCSMAASGLDQTVQAPSRRRLARPGGIRLASDLCRSGSAITVAEFGALAGLTCHASAMAEGPAARYALLQASGGTVATAAAPCLERMAHLPGLHRRPTDHAAGRHPETLKRRAR
jgi:hypothetical protein